MGILWLVGAAAGDQRSQNDYIKVRVKVADASGHSVNNLTPDDFVVTEDGVERNIEVWSKQLGYFRQATYYLSIEGHRSAPPVQRHLQVRVKRPGARPEYVSSLRY
jgi:hypothetical protein